MASTTNPLGETHNDLSRVSRQWNKNTEREIRLGAGEGSFCHCGIIFTIRKMQRKSYLFTLRVGERRGAILALVIAHRSTEAALNYVLEQDYQNSWLSVCGIQPAPDCT